jgi:uncharacterized protein (DUF2249 family)
LIPVNKKVHPKYLLAVAADTIGAFVMHLYPSLLSHLPAATTMTAVTQPLIDVRTIAPRERHPLIFSTFEDLDVGASLELVNDHDPKPLYYQFEAERAGTFGWRYLERGPDVWRVRITKRLPGPVRVAQTHTAA